MYIYSCVIGTFVFNQNMEIREKVLFSDKDIKKIFEMLKEGKSLPSEEAFMMKFKNLKNLREENDEKSLEKVYGFLMGYRQEFYRANLHLTRQQISDSVTDDLQIAQVSNAIIELNKAINMLSKRLREWYGYDLPEVESMLSDHKSFAERITRDSKEKLKRDFNIKNSMGADIDETGIKSLASAILDLFKQKESKENYLEKMMRKTCPNITEVAGYLTGAKLIALAGSLRNMVMMPASTIQLLGAEKALFRHMVAKSKSPKHGIIIEHPLLQRVGKADKGKAARALADKISLAAKLDYFKGEFMGDKLKKELEERFR